MTPKVKKKKEAQDTPDAKGPAGGAPPPTAHRAPPSVDRPQSTVHSPPSAVLWTGLALAVAWIASAAVATGIGTVPVAAGDVLRVIGSRLGMAIEVDPTVGLIVWELRLPRVLLASLTGGGLAVVGVAMQALVRNPLAEPYILGVSGGASAGVSLFYLGWLPVALAGALSISLVAFIGAVGTMAIVYLVAREGARVSTARLLLAGIAMQALLGAITSFVIFASPAPQKLQTILFLLLGSFSGAAWSTLWLPAVAAVGGVLVFAVMARPMDALLTGEEPAQSLGVPVEALKRTLIVLTALVTAVLVAAAGIIGFVGLIIPHAVRFLTGPGHARLLPISFAAGAVFLVWADLAARTVLPAQELPVGVLTAICGVPFFLALLRKAGPG